jgi:DNA/RNA endonuclease YhcR with UshA esterase domain
MKTLSALTAACFLAGLTTAWTAEPAKESERDQQQLAALTKEVQTQQAAIAENQGKINEKVTAIAEALRMAKIYASRSGK